MLYFIGIDDTDNPNTRDTGYIARVLAEKLSLDGLGQVLGITRHQLYVHNKISYTSYNSSLCIALQSKNSDLLTELKVVCGAFLLIEGGEGANPGLCVACAEALSAEVAEFGIMAKTSVLHKADAISLARKSQISLTAHGGSGDGIIGALAAVGLRASGNDGRLIWLKGIREMQGVYTVEQIYVQSGVRSVREKSGLELQYMHEVNVGDCFKPVMMNGCPTLLVEKENEQINRWRSVNK